MSSTEVGKVATIAVSGASGLVGSALLPALAAEGHRVLRLVRRLPRTGEIPWDPALGRLDPSALEGVEAVVHLAGESLISGRWTAQRKQRIRESRERGTSLLSETLTRLSHRPSTLVSASAIGYYGDRGDHPLTERDGPGTGFLAQVVQAWEAATAPAEQAGIRVVRLRFGIVLTPAGGALRRMLPAFRMGLGAQLGSGQQWMSWITLDDLVDVIRLALNRAELRGSVNAVAPEPVTNTVFTHTLARVLDRPTLMAVPPFVLELLFGELAREGLLASARVLPERLQALGHRFGDPQLEPALRRILGRG